MQKVLRDPHFPINKREWSTREAFVEDVQKRAAQDGVTLKVTNAMKSKIDADGKFCPGRITAMCDKTDGGIKSVAMSACNYGFKVLEKSPGRWILCYVDLEHDHKEGAATASTSSKKPASVSSRRKGNRQESESQDAQKARNEQAAIPKPRVNPLANLGTFRASKDGGPSTVPSPIQPNSATSSAPPPPANLRDPRLKKISSLNSPTLISSTQTFTAGPSMTSSIKEEDKSFSKEGKASSEEMPKNASANRKTSVKRKRQWIPDSDDEESQSSKDQSSSSEEEFLNTVKRPRLSTATMQSNINEDDLTPETLALIKEQASWNEASKEFARLHPKKEWASKNEFIKEAEKVLCRDDQPGWHLVRVRGEERKEWDDQRPPSITLRCNHHEVAPKCPYKVVARMTKNNNTWKLTQPNYNHSAHAMTESDLEASPQKKPPPKKASPATESTRPTPSAAPSRANVDSQPAKQGRKLSKRSNSPKVTSNPTPQVQNQQSSAEKVTNWQAGYVTAESPSDATDDAQMERGGDQNDAELQRQLEEEMRPPKWPRDAPYNSLATFLESRNPGLGAATAKILFESGIESPDSLRCLTRDDWLEFMKDETIASQLKPFDKIVLRSAIPKWLAEGAPL